MNTYDVTPTEIDKVHRLKITTISIKDTNISILKNAQLGCINDRTRPTTEIHDSEEKAVLSKEPIPSVNNESSQESICQNNLSVSPGILTNEATCILAATNTKLKGVDSSIIHAQE